MLKKVIGLLVIGLLVLISIVAYKTITAPNLQRNVNALPAPALPDSALQHFRQAIQFKTISYGDAAQWDSLPFIQFRKFLETTYPLVHQHLSRQIINGYSLIYTWEGKNPALKPFILMAHQDVVPIEESSKSLWTVDPFAGLVKDNFIWGRGTTDDKINLIAILEAAEKLLKENYRPERTIYFTFGHDEEIGGTGATEIAHLFESQNIHADLVLDEGGIVTREKISQVTKPVALIGNSEKGYLSLELSVTKKGGHSSMPEEETAIDILNEALDELHKHPFPERFSESTKGLMAYLGPEMSFPDNMAFANPWLFKKLIFADYKKSGPGHAMIHTTMVPTILKSGIKDNVVPSVATAVLNFRLLPGDSSAAVIQRVKEIIHDNRVIVTHYGETISEASPVAKDNAYGFQKVDEIVRKSFDTVVTSPFLVIGATDSRHFSKVSDNVIKFSPMVDPIGFHGIDERVSLESFRRTLWFYELLMRGAN